MAGLGPVVPTVEVRGDCGVPGRVTAGALAFLDEGSGLEGGLLIILVRGFCAIGGDFLRQINTMITL